MKKLLNKFDVRDHYKHTDKENERNEQAVQAVLNIMDASAEPVTVEYRPAYGKPCRYMASVSDTVTDIINVLVPKVGVNVYIDSGSLVFEGVDNYTADYIRITSATLKYYTD